MLNESLMAVEETIHMPMITHVESSVSRVTLAEEAVVVVCIAMLAVALLRHGPRRIHLLLWGFVLMPARDAVSHASFAIGLRPDSMLLAVNLATAASLLGWLLIAAYCLSLAKSPRSG